MKRVYLDYAAATPLDNEVGKVMVKTARSFANPSASYSSARTAKEILRLARKSVAMFLGANSTEIIFISGATEANNLAILGYARAHKAPKARIISIATEHASVYEPLLQLEREGFEVVWCPVDESGQVKQAELKKLINSKTILITISAVNSEFGTVQPIAEICRLAKQANKNVVIHTDASAATNLNLQVNRLGVDLLTLSGAKVYGPKSAGVLYVRRGTKLEPTAFGGAQQRGLRPGSEDVVAAAGMAKALELASQHRKVDNLKFQALYLKLISFVQKNYPKAIINGHKKSRVFWCVSICFAGINGEDLVASLDAAGLEVATGAACEASNDRPSRALMTLGLNSGQAQGSLRVSFGRSTSGDDVDRFLAALSNCLKQFGYN
ncbi:cysteine desulfurase [Candidatus Saccharibacteria bacterium]|nr:cysteine desulfurase [Candidatus Saccharibacteria bacterium]